MLTALTWKDDPYLDPSEEAMRFRLTYEGVLLGASRSNTRAKHKHEIRQRFHKQLKRHWHNNRYLSDTRVGKDGITENEFTLTQFMACQFRRGEYQYVPLVTKIYDLHCDIDILFLRADLPGAVLKSGDIDNHVKTLLECQ